MRTAPIGNRPSRDHHARWLLTIAAAIVGVGAAACGSDAAPETSDIPASQATPTPDSDPTASDASEPTDPDSTASAVAIESFLDLNSTPETGTFEVTEGSEGLGCADGRFYVISDDTNTVVMTCESGPRSGEFRLTIDPTLTDDERFTGPWTIVSGTGDFETLTGGGEFEDVRDVVEGTIIGTRTGEIAFTASGG